MSSFLLYINDQLVARPISWKTFKLFEKDGTAQRLDHA